ncbi:DUF4198 domain-containing protein [Sphingomonas carotinifaciens]|uniref:DUF4198 domain-containing protein n=1 Tax=Sphingomonas carotinifaciens TaxID=1166323 RepID=A0A1G7G689_9SPHN|nr:DUF4198 domain-containing protein [Sphingomonas carotinifaciens]MBB4086403.1 putative GH25 family protein [Sphingomonas carotinifaciens]MWC42722.1 DUF4198 domain-containing protein [Sphingomonas carotinifaciens]SDE83638.1 Uncharacterized conserved protein, contains GH25 family domain [Sphingomonas carotinifaciens]
MKRFLLVATALLSIPAAVSAHRGWLLPSGTIFSGTDSWVTVDAAVSNDLFFFDHQPMRLDAMKVWQPDGTPGQLQNGATGRYRSVFDVKLDKPGTWKIGSENNAVMGSFKVNGEEKRIGRRGPPRPDMPPPLTVADIPANATDVKVTEIVNRNEIFVTAGAPTTTVFKPTGKGLELSPVTHPDELVAGEPAKFRFLVDGKPAANLKVTVIPGGKRYRDSENAMDLTTDAQGLLTVTWPAAGMYWLNATATDNNTTTPRATERRLGYVTTLEVMAP